MKAYGNRPIIFKVKINKNIVKINGKYGLAVGPTVSLIILEIKLKTNSLSSWIFPGTILTLLVPAIKKIIIKIELISIKRLEFVNERSIPLIDRDGPIL